MNPKSSCPSDIMKAFAAIPQNNHICRMKGNPATFVAQYADSEFYATDAF
jgi:hypothetical protein